MTIEICSDVFLNNTTLPISGGLLYALRKVTIRNMKKCPDYTYILISNSANIKSSAELANALLVSKLYL